MANVLLCDNGGVSGVTGIKLTSDTSGALDIKVGNGSVTGLSISAAGVVTVPKKTAAAYQWDSFNPSNTSGAVTNAPSSGTTTDSDYVTLANSSGTVTCTFDVAGSYLVFVTVQTSHANVYTTERQIFVLGGTATRALAYNPNNSGDPANDLNMSITTAFLVTAIAGQTLTVLPTYELTGGGTTGQHTCSCSMMAQYCGG